MLFNRFESDVILTSYRCFLAVLTVKLRCYKKNVIFVIINSLNLFIMALIKMSSIGITAISGKAGGSVYSRNRGGEYVKNFVMPTNTFSEARQAVRSVFGAISSGWRALTQQMRNSWIEAAPLYLRTNAFGDKKQLSANALYVGQNQNLANAELPMINTIGPPEGTNAVLNTISSQIDLTDDEWTFNFDLEGTNATLVNEYVIECTPPHSESVKNVENQFRKLASTAGSAGNTPAAAQLTEGDFAGGSSAMKTLYESKFGTVKAGDVVTSRIKAVNPRTGEVSAGWVFSTVVIP